MRRRLSLLAAVPAALALVLSAAAPASAELPVRWEASALLQGGLTPDEVPGVNDFACRPSAAHPRPVVLVHGLSATMGDNWATLGPLLKNNGFCVFGLSYGRHEGMPYFGGFTPMQESSKELDALVTRVLRETGAGQVDLLGHSEGTVMPRWWLTFMGGAPKVKRYVQLTPLWDGTNLAGIGLLMGASAMAPGSEAAIGELFASIGCGSCPQFAKGSAYLNAVNAAPGPALPGIEYTTIVTKYDELVQPYTSGLLDAPNVHNFVLQDVCATDYAEHLAVAYDPMAGQLILNALAPEQARPVPCVVMTPGGAQDPPAVGLGPEPAIGPASTPASRRCAVRLGIPVRRGAAVRRAVVTTGGRKVATRRGRALRSIRVARVAAGRRTFRLRITDTRGTRTVTLRRTVRCA